jgi:hypothetical protein
MGQYDSPHAIFAWYHCILTLATAHWAETNMLRNRSISISANDDDATFYQATNRRPGEGTGTVE